MTETGDRLARIGSLSRQEKGRKQLPIFLHDLRQSLECPVGPDSLLSLTLTDEVTRAFEQQYQSSKRSPAGAFTRCFRTGTEDSIYKLLDCMADNLSDDDVTLITGLSEICGAVQLTVRSALLHAKQLLALDGDSLLLFSDDRDNGLLLDYRTDDPAAAYELTVFGKAWMTAASRCK